MNSGNSGGKHDEQGGPAAEEEKEPADSKVEIGIENVLDMEQFIADTKVVKEFILTFEQLDSSSREANTIIDRLKSFVSEHFAAKREKLERIQQLRTFLGQRTNFLMSKEGRKQIV